MAPVGPYTRLTGKCIHSSPRWALVRWASSARCRSVAHLEVAHDALEPQEQAIVHQPRVIDPIVIDQHDVRDRHELDQLRPVAIITGEPRRLER
jgi:hypothetical protein